MSLIPNPSAVDLSAFEASDDEAPVMYGLPRYVHFCKKCVISNQRPNSAVEYQHTKASKKATIQLVNQTKIPLEYGVAGKEEEPSVKIEAGKTGTVENVDNSANIAVYPGISLDPDKPFLLKFEVKADPKTNTINVNIVKAKRGFMGHRSINLQETGKVYLY
jgi:hypothetical protein